jgi:hypothetical protein
MDRRRSLLKIAALRSEREQQVGVNCTKGYLQLQSAGLLFEGPRTLECLFRYIPSDKMQVIAGFGISMIEIYALTTNQLRVYCGGGNATVDIIPGDSYLVDVAYDGTTAICYLNGTEAARFPVTGYKITDLFRTGSNTYIPQGSLVFCRHYNYALSAEEVAAHYNDGDPAGYILPRNLKNIKDMAFTSKTFEFDMDSPYYQRVLESGELESGGKYRVDYVVEEWDIAPAVIGSCGISCGVLSTVGTQYWPNLSAAKLGENQYVVVDTKETGTPYMFVYASNPSDTYTSRRLKVTVHSVKMLGCVAEYLPQNLVGQWHEKPFDLSGITTYTWTGETDHVYYQELLLGRFIQTGAVVMIKGSVSDYQSGEPFVYVGNRQAMIPAQNGSFTLKVINNRDNINRIYYYGGVHLSDRRLTITIDSVELIPDVALSWLDSAKQFPLNDEYLPPLFESIVIGDATPIHIMGENSYTWTGVDDPVYSYTVRCSRYFKIGGIYKVRVTISNWEAGGPPYFKIATDNTIIMSGFTGNGTYAFYITAEGIPYDYMFVYAGHGDTDRRMTITVDSIEPIAEHGYDLTANGTPQIIIK